MTEIVLLGGITHGVRFTTDDAQPVYVCEREVEVGVEVSYHRTDRMVSPYPIPGWDFWPVVDESRGGTWHDSGDGITPWWSKRLWMTDEFKEQLLTLTTRLAVIFGRLDAARRTKNWVEADVAADELKWLALGIADVTNPPSVDG